MKKRVAKKPFFIDMTLIRRQGQYLYVGIGKCSGLKCLFGIVLRLNVCEFPSSTRNVGLQLDQPTILCYYLRNE
jgi:hypothetical protein